MASPQMANARIKNNMDMARKAWQYGTSAATGVVHEGIKGIPRKVLGGALGPIGDVLTSPKEVNAEDDVEKIKSWKQND